MRAYRYDNLPGDQRLPHDSQLGVTKETLEAIGVFSTCIPVTDISQLEALAVERGYQNRDEVTVSPSAMGEIYESKVKMFFEEHLHEDEEIRWVLDGTGYFDVRDDRGLDEGKEGSGKWIRIAVVQGDLLVLPAGIYHRFTTGEDNYIKAMRLFKEEPKWTPLNRSAEVDQNMHRHEYLKSLAS